MKELIYRRGASGYEVDRCAEGIPVAKRHRGSLYVLTSMEAEKEAICYRQFRMDDNTIALGMGYMDPHGSRNSLMGHVLYTDAAEVAQLLESYPSCSSYFTRFKDAYTQNQGLHQTAADMEVPVSAFLSGKRGGLAVAPDILKKVFRTPANLAGVFEALLDAASNNAMMVVIFGIAEEPAVMAERGRYIIEALFACLPPVLVRRLGYISPAVNDDNNAIFGVRYSKPRSIDENMRRYAYAYDVSSQQLTAPAKANHAAAEYARELSELVFSADAGAVARIRELKELLDDEALFNAADVPADLAVRYRFYNDKDAVSMADKAYVLDWHHARIEEAAQDAGALDVSRFWRVADKWVVSRMLGNLYANTSAWQDGNPVYNKKRVREIYNDGQRLFRLGRGEARAYADAFAARLGSAPMLDPASEPAVINELIAYTSETVQKARDNNFAARSLYWTAIEAWFRRNWCAGKMFRNRTAVDTVCRLYELDSELGAAYVKAYADDCQSRGTSLLEMVQTSFGKLAYEGILKQNPEYVAESMRRELDKVRLLTSPVNTQAVTIFQAYRRLIGNHDLLKRVFAEVCEGQLSKTMARAQADNIEQLMAELKAENGMIGTLNQLNVCRDARAVIEKRIIELAQRDGIYPYYPSKPQLAREIAELLDKKTGGWKQKLQTLKAAYELPLADLTDEEFDRLMEDGFDVRGDRTLADRVNKLLMSNIEKTFAEGIPDMRIALMAFALHNGYGGKFRPAGMMEDMDRFGVPVKKMQAYCKKQAKVDADRGIAYVARVLLDYSDGDSGNFEWAVYPERYEENDDEEDLGGMFASFPTAVAVVMVAVCGSGLAASIVGLLGSIGLL